MSDRSALRRETDRFLLSLQFFTRIPIPARVPYSESELNQAAVYFPLIGTLIGMLCAQVYWGASMLWPVPIAILLSMVFSLLLTGCFHEDGLADCMDGMGGGWDRERILAIMQDSRLGTYGATALIGALAGKFLLLNALPPTLIIPAMILAHAVSRLNAASMMLTEAYARPDGKAKPLAVQMSPTGLLIAATLALLPFIWIELPNLFWLALLPLVALRFWFARWLRKWIGGFTGDCLGALQQLSELTFLLGVVALCRFI
ncbi:adenosylcobinamide-GDP ribazoletransferase [Pseudomonas sp. NCCP-436]|uniref:adenosylcobinamide-GDP ribazoletransferase n=1 Tax=Pseudomonas sp. NCCP-436 TaxID=2842481 RepID=UPI001C7EDB8A|nr:adenosylcobinamide-GDP ribazoletransferase [Pseudomonas sp. NCCP-436]GIZ11662.1 adenosylcobinamide-GDP ribazoletransferase [Pseudomonas sp. NCCP-436]